MNEGIHLDLDTWIVPGQMMMMMLSDIHQQLLQGGREPPEDAQLESPGPPHLSSSTTLHYRLIMSIYKVVRVCE